MGNMVVVEESAANQALLYAWWVMDKQKTGGLLP